MRGVRGPEGASLLARLLVAGTPGAAVLMTENERERYAVAALPAGRTDELRLDWRSPPLRQHRVNGRAVCPACLSLAAMVRAAAARWKRSMSSRSRLRPSATRTASPTRP